MWKSLQPLQQSNLLAVLLPSLLLMCSLRLCGAKPKGDVCEFNGKTYQIGETFHPRVEPLEDKCINCTCLQGGEVNCPRPTCPKPDCEHPVYVAGECCRMCNVEVEVVRPEVTQSPGCDYDDAHYDEGELFPSNKTAFTPLHDQCVLCECFRSRVYCHLKKCLISPKCIRTVTVSSDCCQQCAEYEEDPNPPKSNRMKPGDCMSSTMGPQKNGTTWKPVVGQYGAMECVVCKCEDGRVDCHRVQCPAKSSYKCKRPQLRKGKCCRECPKKKRTERRVTKKDGNKKRCKRIKGGNKKRPKGRKKRKRCKKPSKKLPERQTSAPSSRQQQSVDTLGNVTMAVAKDKLCVQRKADYIVYVVKGDNSFSLILDNVKSDGTSEKADWDFRRGFIVATRKTTLPSNSPLRQVVNTKQLAGTSIARNVRKFYKILERKLQTCKKNCRRKILEKTMKRLRVKRVNLKKSC